MLTRRQLLQAGHVGFFQLPWLPEAAIRSRGGRFAVVLEGVSHWIPEQVPDELAAYILERIRSVSPTT